MKFNVCGPDHKVCIYIENGLVPRVFLDIIYKCTQLVKKYVKLNTVTNTVVVTTDATILTKGVVS